MNYIEKINTILNPTDTHKIKVLDLFAGCGGLALGFESMGFRTYGYEMNKQACESYNYNLNGNCMEVKLTVDTEFPKADVIIGGPPCQPFSLGGKQMGIADSRDGFPIFISAVKKVNPKIWMFENVKGLLYKNKWYFDQIIKELEELGYIVEYKLLNAKDYGVPQNRERVIVVGHRGQFEFPKPQKNRVTAGEALGEMAYSIPEESKFLTKSMDEYIEKYEKASKCKNPRDLYLDRPARTLTCRNLGGATGDMHRIKLPDGRRRRLLVREAARLQSFPDWFEFKGDSDNKAFEQIGNAVPPMMAYEIAKCIKKYLDNNLNDNIKTINKSRELEEQITIFDYIARSGEM